MTNYSHRNSLKLTLSVRNIQHTSSEFNSTLSTDSAQTILAFSCLFYFSYEQSKKKKNPQFPQQVLCDVGFHLITFLEHFSL